MVLRSDETRRGLRVVKNEKDSLTPSNRPIRSSELDGILCELGTDYVDVLTFYYVEEAAEWAMKSAARPNAHQHIMAMAALTLGLAGRIQEADTYKARIRERVPDYAMADFLAHEINETITDPHTTAWFHNNNAGEVGDLCNFNFGNRFYLPNGASANITLGGKNARSREVDSAHRKVVTKSNLANRSCRSRLHYSRPVRWSGCNVLEKEQARCHSILALWRSRGWSGRAY